MKHTGIGATTSQSIEEMQARTAALLEAARSFKPANATTAVSVANFTAPNATTTVAGVAFSSAPFFLRVLTGVDDLTKALEICNATYPGLLCTIAASPYTVPAVVAATALGSAWYFNSQLAAQQAQIKGLETRVKSLEDTIADRLETIANEESTILERVTNVEKELKESLKQLQEQGKATEALKIYLTFRSQMTLWQSFTYSDILSTTDQLKQQLGNEQQINEYKEAQRKELERLADECLKNAEELYKGGGANLATALDNLYKKFKEDCSGKLLKEDDIKALKPAREDDMDIGGGDDDVNMEGGYDQVIDNNQPIPPVVADNNQPPIPPVADNNQQIPQIPAPVIPQVASGSSSSSAAVAAASGSGSSSGNTHYKRANSMQILIAENCITNANRSLGRVILSPSRDGSDNEKVTELQNSFDLIRRRSTGNPHQDALQLQELLANHEENQEIPGNNINNSNRPRIRPYKGGENPDKSNAALGSSATAQQTGRTRDATEADLDTPMNPKRYQRENPNTGGFSRK